MTDKTTEAGCTTPATGAVGSLVDQGVRPAVAEATSRDEWQSAVFTLMGHGSALYMEGKHDMPAWCYELAEKIARTHVDEAHARQVRQVAVQQRARYGEPA